VSPHESVRLDGGVTVQFECEGVAQVGRGKGRQGQVDDARGRLDAARNDDGALRGVQFGGRPAESA